MSNRETYLYVYTFLTGFILLLGAFLDPPTGWWRVFLHTVIPITLILASAWCLISKHIRR